MDIIAIAVTQGHVQRAIDFYNKEGKFFVIGGTTPWADETSPDTPNISEYKLKDTVGYKKVDNCYLVVPDENGSISYRTQNWRIVPAPYSTTLADLVSIGGSTLHLMSAEIMKVGNRVRIGDIYEGIILDLDTTTGMVTIDTPAPAEIPEGTKVHAGALVEGAKYVYAECYLNYDQFPVNITYRQVGLCSEVQPSNASILLTGDYSTATPGKDEFTSSGVLEILDNRSPSTRDIDQRELLSCIVEF